jgi:hypothetical protein
MRTSINEQPKELGKVFWYRNYQQALERSVQTSRPVFLLFQEVPGCSTCVNFGTELLSYPLLVEAIENEFIPLAIYNNVKGEDENVLKRYNEPAWNNPVVRIVDGTGSDIVPGLGNPWDPFLLYRQMKQAMEVSGKKLPGYAELLLSELKIKYGGSATAYYETPCFWSGETSMIQHPAVLATEAGWIGGREVVKVTYDPQAASIAHLDKYAAGQGFHLLQKTSPYAKDVNPQYYLKGSIFRLLPLGYSQRSVLNYAIPYTDNEESYLSPLQHQLLLQHRKNGGEGPGLYDLDIEESWPFPTKKSMINH